MRYSKQREIVLKTIQSTDTHPTANQVFVEVRREISNISLGTVYRNLNQLVKNNFLKQYSLDRIIHYDGNLQDHNHFYCERCKIMIDIPELIVDLNCLTPEPDFKITGMEILLSGICNKCQNK